MVLFLVAIFVLGIAGISQAGPEFDFEKSDILAEAAPGFQAQGSSSRIEIRSDKHKGGKNSLLWEWDAKPHNTLNINLKDIDVDLSIKGDELKKGGLKFWMYHVGSEVSTMEIAFHGGTPSKETSATIVNLNFKGWRAVWIGYAEFFEGTTTTNPPQCPNGWKDKNKEGVGMDAINKVEFRITSSKQDKLYIDMVRFVASMNKQTRDMVVKQVSSAPTAANDFSFYDEKDFWQRSLRWYKETPTHCTPTQENPTQGQLDDILEIEERLKNWYATDDQIRELTFDSVEPTILGIVSSFKDFETMRWKELYGINIKNANKLLPKVLENKPSLFALSSDQGDEGKVTEPKTKFSLVFFKVLLPLAIKYNFKSRQKELTKAENEGSSANEDTSGDSGTCEDIEDDDDLKNIAELLLYIEDQGWAAGSGIGTLGHEMNKSGAGFIHSMFLLRTILQRRCATLFGRLLDAMKWYTDFNEIYQKNNDYIYDGTTADRMRTILFYRLMVILMETDKNVQVRDMHCYKNWVNHILKVNQGLGGFVKPDYTASHHKTFYGSAYVPQALHNTALVQYLLDRTSFALDNTAKRNLRNVLGVLRTTAVKYSTPNSICGRFPSYDKAILAQMIPAYAYISCVHGQTKSCERVKDPEMFLRLAEPLDGPDLKAYLEKGKMTSPIHYWHTLGSLDILDKVKKASNTQSKRAETSPSGHWSKNFAALSIHRRGEWSVAAKGFNRYVWDFEKADSQNVFGVFVSHGSLQISNSEAALKAYDVENGWDWTRIPGATTVNLDLDNIRTDNARYYNPGGFAGGVTLIGSDDADLGPQNGAFGMKFKKPDYEMKTNKASPLNKMDFRFKKSYFFHDHLIVAVGSNIRLGGVDRRDRFYAQTTLFQDKLVDLSNPSNISINNQKFDLRVLLKSWKRSTRSTVALNDTHGNMYQVKTDANTELNVKISDQGSRKSNGCDKSNARYATAWIIHKKRNNNNKYEYAVLVRGGKKDMLSKYKVKRIENNKAHAVHFWKTASPSSEGVFAYSIFKKNIDNNFGPVKSTDSPCMIMAKKEANALYLSISNPSLSFEDVTNVSPRLTETCSGTNRRDLDKRGCIKDLKSPSNSNDVHTKMMFCVNAKKEEITVTLNCDFGQADIEFVKVDGKARRNSRRYAKKLQKPKKVMFRQLADGFTTEIKINNPRCAYAIA